MIDSEVLNRATSWLNGSYDQETKDKIQYLIEKDQDELTDSFYRDLEFGTGGLRGIMGVGTNRMNKYTVGMATQGLVNYLKISFGDLSEIRVAVAHDSRNNSRFFAQVTANVLSSNGFRVFLFENLRPTPELSYAIRNLKCQSGINVTASHNPKEYNGYKVYWNDGAQLVSPHDKNVINEVLKIQDITMVDFVGNPENITIIGEEIDREYITMIKSNTLSLSDIEKQSNLKIVYTPIHGSGWKLVPRALKSIGFQNVYIVKEQENPDGNFPTVKSPNPEEPAALFMALEKARDLNADLVLATDPDADRLGVAVKDLHGNFILLNGNQTATLLTWYLLYQWKETGRMKGSEFMVKTIVTSELLKEIADSYHIEMFDVLTGFKWIAAIIRELEGKRKFIGGGEESYGFMVGDDVRDKDAVAACSMIAEAAAWAANNGMSLYELLIDIYVKYKFYYEGLITLTKKGKTGAEEIQQLMDNYRSNPIKTIIGLKVSEIRDYQLSYAKNLLTGQERAINLPKSNVLQFFLEDGSKITVRPSGTEPKIKYYFGVVQKLDNKTQFESVQSQLEGKIKEIINEMNLR